MSIRDPRFGETAMPPNETTEPSLAQRERDLFLSVLELPDAAARARKLDEICGQNEILRNRIRALLDAHERVQTETQAIGASVGDQIGPYKLLQLIGEGGFGHVFVAEQTAPLRRRVALKLIKAGMDTRQVVARFDAERQALAMMDHPNIARVLDAGATSAGKPYFVMELVRGVPITRFCDDNRLSARQRVELMIPVCQAVQHAHQKGIIHRDLKPNNVLVTLHDGIPVPKVIDFGIAKATHQPLTDMTVYTEFRQMIGTPAYMSPEQAEMSGLDVDTRSDIYSLGVLAYELLTGTTPFDARRLFEAGLHEIQRIIREEEPPRPSLRLSTLGEALTTVADRRGIEPSRLGKIVTGDLDWIVMKAIEKDRRRRYGSASEMAADLQRHLSGEAVIAAPPSAAYRASKFLRKHRGPTIALACIGVALLAGLISSAALWRQAEQASASEQRRAAIAESEAYVGNLALAQIAIDADLWPEARARLDACAPALRGIEWDLLRNEAESVRHVLPGAWCNAAISPDGSYVVTLDQSRSGAVWDAATGRKLRLINAPVGPDDKIHRSEKPDPLFSRDGRWCITTNGPHLALLDMARGGEPMTTLSHEALPHLASFGVDGQSIHVLSNPRYWELKDDDFIRVAGTATVWNLDGTKRRSADIPGIIDISPDGQSLLVSVAEKQRQYRVIGLDGTPRGDAFTLGRPPAFSPDGRFVYGTDDDVNKTLLAFELSGKQMPTRISPPWGHATAAISRVQPIVLASLDWPVNQVELYRLDNGTQVGPIIPGLASPGFTAGDRLIVTRRTSISKVNTLQLTDDTGRPRAVITARPPHELQAAHFARATDTGILMSGAKKHDSLSIERCAVIDISTCDSPRQTFGESENEALSMELALLNTDIGSMTSTRLIATPEADGTLRVRLDGVDRGRIGFVGDELPRYVVMPDASRIITAGRDGQVRFWDPHNCRQVASLRAQGPVASLQLHGGGRRIVIGLEGNRTEIWDRRKPAERQVDRDLRFAEAAVSRDTIDGLVRRGVRPSQMAAMINADTAMPPLRRAATIEQLRVRLDASSLVYSSIRQECETRREWLAALADWTEPFVAAFLKERIAQAQEWPFDLQRWAWETAYAPGREAVDYEQAFRDIELALKLDPESEFARSTRGLVLFRLGRLDESLAACEESRRFREDRNFEPLVTDHAVPAMIQHRRGDLPAARQALQAASETLNGQPRPLAVFNEAAKLIDPSKVVTVINEDEQW